MFSSYGMLSRLLLTAGEVRGRKKVQKLVFIAQTMGCGFEERFDLHMWGPYSDALAIKLKEMADWGFAGVEELPGPAGNSHYIYRPGPNADQVALPEEPSFRSLVEYLNQQDASFLEGVATALFLREQGKDESAVRALLPRLKPDKFADAERVSAVLNFADNLKTQFKAPA